jgi:putative tricarboxylic transport membrane protein
MILENVMLALSPLMIGVCLAGVTLGILWGAMPGLSTTMAMALLIGLSAGMEQYVGLMFMLGVYTGSVFGGAISAVLINIPGTPDAVPTMMEGYPLAQRGEGGQALGTAIAASFLGNWVGIVLLIAFIPLLLSLALEFRSWEMFLLAMWGIAISGTMASGEMPLKGWISGWIGLIVAFVGLDDIHGVARFSFGHSLLEDGISYVPILIGLFGLTEILRVLPQDSPTGIPSEVGRVVPPFSRIWRFKWTALRSGLIGTVIGAIPGAGANVASFLSYDVARRRARPEERAKWGKGSYEGIISAEVANNANIGGSMLPTLTLGIPGNAAAAAILAALELKNVVVGPMIQIEHPGLIHFIYIALIVANFLMYGMAILLIKPCVKLFSLPPTLLLPLIIPLCVIGSFAVNLNYFDVFIMFAAGIVGYILRRFAFPLAPMVLAVILGPVADENLRRALLVFEDMTIWQVLTDNPIGTVLLVVVALTFYDGIFRRGR